MSNRFFSILSVAGSDSSGGAGIQADIKAASYCGVYAATAITSVTSQSTYGVDNIFPLPAEVVRSQIIAAFTDKTPDALKIGMIGNVSVGESIMGTLRELDYKGPIIVDPVLSATSGRDFAIEREQVIEFYRKELGRMTTVLTPNLPEARILAGINPEDETDPLLLCDRLIETMHCKGIALKGGHAEGALLKDIFVSGNEKDEVVASRIASGNLHGTGCTFSTILACGMANGMTMSAAFRYASIATHKIIENSVGYTYGNPNNGPLRVIS